MKCISLFLFLMLYSSITEAQVDQSPMDMAYFPDNFAHDRKKGEKAFVRVIYSRPQKKSRSVFGDLVPYGKVWRTGANENTEIKLYQDARIQGKTLKAGTYSMFTVPDEKEWTIIFNKELDFWGAYSYQEASDVLRVKVKTASTTEPVEYFSITFEDAPAGALMVLSWDTTMVEVPFEF